MTWDWSDPDSLAGPMEEFNGTLARCEKLEPVPVTAPYTRAQLRDRGVTGIEFAAWKTGHPAGIGTDLVPLRSAEVTTVPDQMFLVDGDRHFLQLDIGDPLPFDDACVEWVYAEHLIEHVPVPVAIGWLAEVRRILVPGGLLRLTTPDLHRYVEAYLGDGAMFATHRRRMRSAKLGPPMPQRRAFMFNQLFYLYGHRWIYDVDELQHVLGEAGFDPGDVQVRAFREGARPDVAELDRMLRRHESLYVEATRPHVPG